MLPATTTIQPESGSEFVDASHAEQVTEEAEAVLEALVSSLTWVKSRSPVSVVEGAEPGTDNDFLLGFAAGADTEAGHRFVIRPVRTTAHWTASSFSRRSKTQIRALRRTRAVAKVACEHYLTTGNWENVAPEPSLEWRVTASVRQGKNARETLLYRAVGRNIQYRLLERRWMYLFRRYFIICDAHQCVMSGDRVFTGEVGFESADLPDCMAAIKSRLFRSIAVAKMACERHHATGKWSG